MSSNTSAWPYCNAVSSLHHGRITSHVIEIDVQEGRRHDIPFLWLWKPYSPYTSHQAGCSVKYSTLHFKQ
ncbi:hypothetical protein FRX31_032352 [Thalictrum thalictroides]|uniref:Uncharacterized protein n=1 Tax=Thalictrum thalictroides TaxID=46969 RepID=A0A7J6V013_THATH|nr:hypothetical protein FRX31_032352 [Thalictrum thalictroides]